MSMNTLISSLYSQDQRPSDQIRKLDTAGNYTTFEGITIVMPLLNDLSPLFRDLQKVVPKSYHSLLPLESYHVTLSGITCRSYFMNCQLYNQFLDYYIPVLHQLQQEMNTHQVPRINYKLITKVTERNFYQITAYLQIADNESKEKIDKFCQLGKQYLGDVFVYSEPHMSMAYRIAKNESKETKKAIVDVLNKHLNGTVLSFGHPQVCKFDDMCEFKPIFSNL